MIQRIGHLLQQRTTGDHTSTPTVRGTFAQHLRPSQPTAPAAPAAEPGAAASPVARLVHSTVADLEQQRREVDQAISRARSGASFSPAELLALQAQVHDYSLKMEIFSRAVDRATSALKTTLNTQL